MSPAEPASVPWTTSSRDCHSPVEDCDDESQSPIDLCKALFTGDGTCLRQEFKNGKFGIWGKSLDRGRVVLLNTIELLAPYRGKGMFTSILPDLEEFARLKSISAFFMLPAPLHESIVDGSSRSTDFGSDRDDLDRHGFAMRKLAKHYSQIGFRFLGKTRYMAMVPNNR